MKYLLATAGYSNPELLEKCVKSWPRITRQVVFFDKITETSPLWKFYEDFYLHDFSLALGNAKHLGVSGSWNEILKFAFSDCEFDAVIVVGSDTEMQPGFLEGFIQEFEEKQLEFALTNGFSWNCWCMTKKCYETVGDFDCNFFPAYFEDNDMHYRINLSELPQAFIGDPSLFWHYGSATIKIDNNANTANGSTFGMNSDYFVRKWGGAPLNEKFKTPFDDPNLSIKDWTLDQEIHDKKYKLWNK